MNFSNIDVIDSQHDAVFINSFSPEPLNTVLDNVFFTNLNIDGTGTALDVNNGPNFTGGQGESGGHGFYAANYASNNRLNGWVEVTGQNFSNIAGEDIAYFQSQPEFEIRTNGSGGNRAPSANAGQDQLLENSITTATLEGTGSDPDGDAITYAWTQTAGPTVTIASNSTASTMISGLEMATSYTFLLTVSDGDRTGTDSVTIRIKGDTNNSPGFTMQNVWNQEYLKDEGDVVTYDGDPTGAEYLWVFEELANGTVEIKNVATGDYMHVQDLTGSVQATARDASWQSAKWILEDTGEGNFRIENVQQTDEFIHLENLTGNAELGAIFPVWASARWIFNENTTLSISNRREAQSVNNITIFPNPASENFSINLHESIGTNGSVALYTMSGKLVLEQNIPSTEFSISTTQFAAGMYLIKITSDTVSKTMQLLISQ